MINIAINTFREIVRNKFLYLILFFAFIFILFTLFLGKLTINDDAKIITDFGLGMIELFGLAGVLFVGSQLLFNEVEGKTIFLILSKPIKRYEFILGKFMGFSATIGLIILLQGLLFFGVLALKGVAITHLIVFSVLFTFLKLEIILGIVFLFSTFMSNMLTILTAIMVYMISHSFSLLLDLANRTKNALAVYFTQGLQILFPPLEALNIKDVIGSFTQFPVSFFVQNTLYSCIYLAIILFVTVLIFNTKKFEN